ncbi:NarK family nitrate/nitrite MFS transporter [Tenggerimyces flavus]|uniref:Nitrate/nitrite transporter n=1 Tax=Tenggerimyces flavus TaxID=1708749 RepID=A0ABV7YPF9_9ACTN|nr:NarK family nitrate/nitrite MFS transporter [Tenggerimyces flavus]MBM7785742.1 NNP family nitrate/nitrite transporter-like MFS transporter [Tenggerimyces flavus]
MTTLDTKPAPPTGSGRWINVWEPEDATFWARTGRRIAIRNLIFSVFAEHLGFLVWLLWSVVVVSLPAAGFNLTVDQLFWLVAVPNLVGATLRIPYTFAVTRFGGRNWTVISALLLLIPTGLLAVAVSNPTTEFTVLLIVAATAGLGGGNFASSMTNITFFFPERRKGFALGLNAAGGNLGTSVVQFAVPWIVAVGAAVSLSLAGLIWVPFVLAAAICAFVFMDNLKVAQTPIKGQLEALKRPQTWVMSFLYIGTFGSFVGYTAAFPLLIKNEFPNDAGLLKIAFIGALIGSVIRPVGGWLSDKVGGARVTLGVFAAMILGMVGVLIAVRTHSLAMFLGSFAVLFASAGTGNGSTYRMIPAIFRAQGEKDAAAGIEDARAKARTQGAACLGIAGAIGAFGGFLIPRAYGSSIAATGVVDTAVIAYAVFYAVCFGVTWWFYLRRQLFAARMPSLAEAAV